MLLFSMYGKFLKYFDSLYTNNLYISINSWLYAESKNGID